MFLYFLEIIRKPENDVFLRRKTPNDWSKLFEPSRYLQLEGKRLGLRVTADAKMGKRGSARDNELGLFMTGAEFRGPRGKKGEV